MRTEITTAIRLEPVASRPRGRQHARAVGLAIAPLLALAACSPGDPVQGGSGGERLADYLGYQPGGFGMQNGMVTGPGFSMSIGSEPEMSPEQRHSMQKVEDAVAECMNEQGFEYVPYVPSGGEKFSEELRKATELTPEEFVEQHGYGLTMELGMGEAAGEGRSDDPNSEIRSRLSPSAQEAYDKALLFDERGEGGGPPPTKEDGGGGQSVEVAGNGGCRGEAEKEVFGEQPGGPGSDMEKMMNKVEEFDGLFRDLEALNKRIDRDPTMAEANRDWSNCMADAGYADLAMPDDAISLIRDRMEQVFQPVRDGGEAVELDNAAITEIRAYELKVAGTDFDCRTDDYTETTDEVRQKHETTFIADHRTELEQYRDWLAETESEGGMPTVMVG